MEPLADPIYIGSKEIYLVEDIDGTSNVNISFKKDAKGEDSVDVILNKELFNTIKSNVPSMGNITDHIRDYFARKFLAELAYYDLEYYFVNNVAVGMETLAHNLREELFRKTFVCSGGDAINLKLLAQKVDKTE